MDVSSTPSTGSTNQVDVLKKAIDVKEQQVLKVLEGATQQSQQVTAQKTGMGNSLNITG
ncbi:hypothetical protein [Sulfurimonas sp.]|jgi:hypothetical protein|uniref:hypothetical protein n=1 Tax=Sulfurimonas sp. TaxID=2022749 RepID=UPI0025D19FD2|nr:hypothetical protein [Sulfurimonas sp.]MBT5935686.1 hypothetical protein [Sulfurimonas sp.]